MYIDLEENKSFFGEISTLHGSIVKTKLIIFLELSFE